VLGVSPLTGDVEELFAESSANLGSGCITDSGFLYTCSQKAVLGKYALAGGKLLWETALTSSGEEGQCASAVKYFAGRIFVKVKGEGLFIVNSDGTIFAKYKDADCGAGTSGSGPSFDEERFVACYKSREKVLAVSCLDGSLSWSASTAGGDTQTDIDPVIGLDGSVYVQAAFGDKLSAVFAFSPKGQKLWQADLAEAAKECGGLALSLDGQRIYASHDGGFAVLSASDGAQVYNASIGAVPGPVIPVADGYLYAVTSGQSGASLVCFNDKNGSPEEVWRQEISPEKNPACPLRPLVLASGDIVCGTATRLVLVRPLIPEPAILGMAALLLLAWRNKLAATH